MDVTSLPYRPCVGTLVLNRAGQVWIGRRHDAPNEPEGPGAWWQMPQGGIDEGEDAAQAALRELYEETGMRSVELIAESPRLVHLRSAAGAGASRPGAVATAARSKNGSPCGSSATTTRLPIDTAAGASDRVRCLALGGHGRVDRPDRALQARRLPAGRAGLRGPRQAARVSGIATAVANSFTLLTVFRDNTGQITQH